MRDRAEDHPRRFRFIAPLLAALAMLALFGPGLARHAQQLADPFVFADDVAQHVAPYLATLNSEPDDYIHSYLRACHPIGYRALYTIAASIMDPRPFSKVLTGLLFATLLVLLAFSARAHGGWAAAVFVVAAALSADIFLNRMACGLVRAFAFPLTAALLYGILHARIRWMLVVSILAAAFYPTVAITGGLVLALLLLVLPAHLRGEAATWSLARRTSILACTAAAMAVLVLPTMIGTRVYGPLLPRDAEVNYPEAGVGGRSREPVVSADYAENPAVAFFQQAGRAFASNELWIAWPRATRRNGVAGFVALALLGLGFAAARKQPAALRLAVTCIAILAVYALAVLVSPRLYLPERYLLFSAPIIALLAIPLCLDALLAARPALRSCALVCATVALLAMLGGPVERSLGTYTYPKELTGPAAAVARLPPSACVAGWPPQCDFLPYLTGRRVFLSYETHLAFHQAYVEEMRTRMDALIATYCATNLEPILALRARGVTHLLVNTAHLAQPPPYFKPFDEQIARARGNLARNDLALDRLLDQAIWTDGANYLLDLALIDKTTR